VDVLPGNEGFVGEKIEIVDDPLDDVVDAGDEAGV